MKVEELPAKNKETDSPEWGPKVVSNSVWQTQIPVWRWCEFLFCGANAGDWIILLQRKGSGLVFTTVSQPTCLSQSLPLHHTLLDQLLPPHLRNVSFSPWEKSVMAWMGNALLRPASYGIEKARRPQESETARKSQQPPTGWTR